MMILKLILITFEQELTEDEEFSNVVFVKVDCDELEVGYCMQLYSCTPIFDVFLYHYLLGIQ